jgi:hypothetical protein
MTGAIRKFACIGLLAALAACATKPDNSQALLDANAAYFAQDFTCTRAGAAAVDFVKLAAHAEKYADACVRTQAFTDAVYLYTAAGEMQPRRKAANVHPVLGTYWKSGDIEHRLRVGPSFVTAVGRVRRCADYLRLKQDGDALRAKLGQLPPVTILPPSPCRNSTMGLFVSEAQVIPTAMD